MSVELPELRRPRATGVASTPAIAARPMIAESGSCRASTASSESSRKEAKTARGATSTAGARSHQLRSSAEARAGSTVAAMRRRVASGAGSGAGKGTDGEEDQHEVEHQPAARHPRPRSELGFLARVRLAALQQECGDQGDEGEE